ncbi:hypothetical protein [Altericista sp. CCNU0014]|uniref:hypothetical protein n=1 Tax=Altericista sp. CCNU0014 TaxID=3082949 RepID=UPI00384F8022
MSEISIHDLRIAGSGLFADPENFIGSMQDLSENELKMTLGGKKAGKSKKSSGHSSNSNSSNNNCYCCYGDGGTGGGHTGGGHTGGGHTGGGGN